MAGFGKHGCADDDSFGLCSPEVFIRQEEKGSPFPIEAFPACVRDAVKEYHAYGQQPLALVATSALSAVALACQGLADVARDQRLIGPISLNTITIANSGERKTAADREFTRSARQWLYDRQKELEPWIIESRSKLSAFEAKRAGILAAIKSAKNGSGKKSVIELEKELTLLDLERPEVVIAPEMFYGDVNPASLGGCLSTGHPVGALWDSEAGVVIGGNGMRDETIMLFFGMLNKLWDDGNFSNKRSSVESVRISGRRFSCSLMMQEQVAQELFSGKRGLARGIGTLARFLIVKPESTIGSRPYHPPSYMPALESFHARVRELLDMPLPFDEGRKELTPPVIHLAEAAKRVWIKFHNAIEEQLAVHGDYASVKDFASKAPENAARIAAIFHVFENGPVGPIPEEAMLRATRIVLYYLDEARRILSLLDKPQNITDSETLLSWLIEQGRETIKIGDILRLGPGRLRDKKRRDAALSLLEEYNWLKLQTDGKKQFVQLHPEVCEAANVIS
jgi:hypothetical protein